MAEIKTVGVIGAGQMGSGIAHVCAVAGYTVLLNDIAPAKVAAAAPSHASGAWRIQLGAFSRRGAAEALYRKLSGSAAFAGRSAFYIPVGPITRLQVGPYASRASAAAACAAVRQACFPVAVK